MNTTEPQPASALTELLAGLLAAEEGILDPDDADALAESLARQLPPVYRAAPELLAALQALVKHNCGHPHGVTVSALDPARAAIAKAAPESGEPVFPQYRIEFSPRSGFYLVGILRNNGEGIKWVAEFASLEDAKMAVRSRDPYAVPVVSA